MLKRIHTMCRRLHTAVRVLNLRSKLRAARFDRDIARAELMTAPFQLDFLTKHIHDLQAEISRLEASHERSATQ